MERATCFNCDRPLNVWQRVARAIKCGECRDQ